MAICIWSAGCRGIRAESGWWSNVSLPGSGTKAACWMLVPRESATPLSPIVTHSAAALILNAIHWICHGFIVPTLDIYSITRSLVKEYLLYVSSTSLHISFVIYERATIHFYITTDWYLFPAKVTYNAFRWSLYILLVVFQSPENDKGSAEAFFSVLFVFE